MDTYWSVLQLVLCGLVFEVPDLAEVGIPKPALPLSGLKTFVRDVPKSNMKTRNSWKVV